MTFHRFVSTAMIAVYLVVASGCTTLDRKPPTPVQALAASLPAHDSLFSVTRLQTRLFDAAGQPLNHDPGVLMRTQDLPPVYEENSNIYLFSDEQIAHRRRIGDAPLLFETDPLESTDIDEEHDFVIAEMLHRMRAGAA